MMIPYEGNTPIEGMIPRGDPTRIIPEVPIKEKAFYSTSLTSENPVADYQTAAQGLQANGESQIVSNAEGTWMNEQQYQNREVIKNIVSDPNLPNEHKKTAVLQHALGLNISQNLRDKYVQKTAAENNDVTQADTNHRDKWIQDWYSADAPLQEQAKMVEKMKNSTAAGFSGTLLDALGGIGANLVPGRYGYATAMAEWHTMHKDMSPTMRGWEFMKSFMFPGEANHKMNQAYQSMNDYDKAQFIKDLGDAWSMTPGFDFNKWEVMRDTIDSPDGLTPIWRHLENVAGIMDVFAYKGFISAGLAGGFLRTIKSVVRHWTVMDDIKPAPEVLRPKQDPTMTGYKKGETYEGEVVTPKSGETHAGDPNPRTGTGTELAVQANTGVKVPPKEGEFLGKEQLPPGQRPLESEEASRVRQAKDITPKQGQLGQNKQLTGPESTIVKPPIRLTYHNVDTPKTTPSTGSGVNAGTSGKRTNSPLSSEDYLNIQRLRVPPLSPAGSTAGVNPKKARGMYTAGVMDETEEVADAMGTNRASLMSDGLFPKLDADVLQHPSIAKDIEKMDRYFAEVYHNTQFDPFFISSTTREIDKEKLFNTFKEHKEAHYQQANSVLRETIDRTSGVAVYGRNADYGFDSAEEAQYAASKMGKGFEVLEKNGQWYVQKPFAIDYDPFQYLAMGPETINASFAGIKAEGLAKSKLGNWVFLPTQRMNPKVPEGAAMAHFKTAKVEADYRQIIEKEIKNVSKPVHLENELNMVLENQQWSTFADMNGRLSAQGLTPKQVEEVYRGYSFYKRLLDYQYAQANRVDRSSRELEGQMGIYNELGVLVNYGIPRTDENFRNADTMFDLDFGVVVNKTADLKGRKVVRLVEPIKHGDEMFTYGVVGGRTSLHELPTHTLPRIEGYIPRINTENFYITKTPLSVKVNGRVVTGGELNAYAKTIAGESTIKDANILREKLAIEYPDHKIDIKQERSDAATSIITDHKVYKEMMEHSQKRGERLPSLYGKSRLENPLESLWKSVQGAVRLDLWRDYDTVFRGNWLKHYGEFTKGEFPNVLTDITAHPNMSLDDMKNWKASQRYFEQYTNQKYKMSTGDELWKNALHNVADSLDTVAPKYVLQALRDYGGKGNQLVRIPRAITSALFLHLNPMRQWTVQTQQLLEWSALSPAYLKLAPTHIPGLITAILSKASMVGDGAGAMYAAGWKMSGMPKAEFDATFKAIFDSGLPHSVDLNMMLHGAFAEAKMSLSRTDPASGVVGNTFSQAMRHITNVVKFPAVAGKAIGYSPAELANTLGTWLFMKERWKGQHPEQNWNTPETIARITADAWEVAGSMSTRAGSMPYQEGALGLLFQFQRIGHAKFMDVFSSKVFTPMERAKLAAVRALLWGTKGVPAAGVAGWLIGEYTDAMTQAEWVKFEGGLADQVGNTALDIMLRVPGEKESDLAFSTSMSPTPQILPYADFIIAAKQALTGGEGLNSFPFVSGLGRGMKAAHEISRIWMLNPNDSEDAFHKSALELGKMASGVNNYAKAVYMNQFDHKANSFGTNIGIETTRAMVVGQLFGIISKEEEYMYKIQESNRQRDEFINDRTEEINKDLNSYANRYGTPDYTEWVRTQGILLSYTPESVRREIEAKVDVMQRKQYNETKDNAYMKIMQAIGAESDKWVNKGLGYLQNSKNPKDKETAKRVMESQEIMRKVNGYSE